MQATLEVNISGEFYLNNHPMMNSYHAYRVSQDPSSVPKQQHT